jgi:hypothetical protein
MNTIILSQFADFLKQIPDPRSKHRASSLSCCSVFLSGTLTSHTSSNERQIIGNNEKNLSDLSPRNRPIKQRLPAAWQNFLSTISDNQ